MVPDSTATAGDSTHPVDHSGGLSEAFGRIFDSSDACDFLIVAQSASEDGSELETQTVCSHKMILAPYEPFNVSAGAETLTISVSRPCLQHFATFIRYQVICIVEIKGKVVKTL